ncbi:hypothetical protein IW261DRAFT_1594039 [Armillaria novae-zelandiae]|uniref:Heterokaryon incompatibility domain-containing protein n=1 Tax=Armillaria novae-zelandiae TaxID=153914 RepID=A0AA39P6P3_9AGAR|nr:hypothetical protein IW261DRAFT_1594039 [Armillaria novae-zelandiae]
MQPHLEPQQLEHTMDISNTRSKWDSAKLKGKVVAYECKWMSEKQLRKLLQRVNRKSGQLPEVTISSQTEIGQTEESIKVPQQRAYTGRAPVISSSLADTPCSSLGVQGLLDLLNTTLRTSYTLNTPHLSSVLGDCIAHEYDFGTAYGRLRKTWHSHFTGIQMELQKCEAEDIKRRKDALAGSLIVRADMDPRRVWDLRAWTVQEVGVESTTAGRIQSPYGTLSAMQDRISTYKVAGLAYSLRTRSIPAYYESQSLEDAWTALVNVMLTSYRGDLLFTYPEPGMGCKKWRPSWKQVMEKPLPTVIGDWEWHADVRRNDDDWFAGPCIERGFVRELAMGGEEGIDRCGELVVEDKDGITHAFHITASHQYPIPEDTYTLLADDPNYLGSPQHWVVGRRLPNKMFEKVSVFEMTDPEGKRMDKLGLSAKSFSILA